MHGPATKIAGQYLKQFLSKCTQKNNRENLIIIGHPHKQAGKTDRKPAYCRASRYALWSDSLLV